MAEATGAAVNWEMIVSWEVIDGWEVIDDELSFEEARAKARASRKRRRARGSQSKAARNGHGQRRSKHPEDVQAIQHRCRCIAILL